MTLHALSVPPLPVSSSVVEACRDLLAKAETGELRSFAFVGEMGSGEQWLQGHAFAPHTSLLAMLGMVSELRRRLEKAVDEAP